MLEYKLKNLYIDILSKDFYPTQHKTQVILIFVKPCDNHYGIISQLGKWGEEFLSKRYCLFLGSFKHRIIFARRGHKNDQAWQKL